MLVVLLAWVALAGCGDQGTGSKGYISADGLISKVDPADRAKPGPVSGTTLEGETWTLADHTGKPVVINFWASWCPPCRAEAPDLAAAARELGDEAVFIGVDNRDLGKAEAQAFVASRDLPYPSLYDPSGELTLAFHGTLPPNALPSTLVIDANGRVAAVILGRVPSARTLVDLVREVEKS